MYLCKTNYASLLKKKFHCTTPSHHAAEKYVPHYRKNNFQLLIFIFAFETFDYHYHWQKNLICIITSIFRSIRPSVPSRHVPLPIPTVVSQIVTNKSYLVYVKSEKYTFLVNLRPHGVHGLRRS